MGMMRVIVDEGLLDSSFVEQRCENFDVLKESLQGFGKPPDRGGLIASEQNWSTWKLQQ